MSSESKMPKKRGRPRKTVAIVNKPNKNKILEKKIQNDDDDEIIIDLPVFESDANSESSSEIDDGFTMKDDSNNEAETLKSLSRDSSDEESNIDYLNEIKKRDQIIKQLREKLDNMRLFGIHDNIITATKENKRTILDMKLITIGEDNKLVIAEKTNISCFWCTYTFDSLPCFLPDRYFKDSYYVFGCFCSFGCVVAYNQNLNDYRTQIRHSLLTKMYNTIFNNNTTLPIAPQREMLEKFGGPLSIDEFRDTTVICRKEFKMAIPPVIPLISHIDETNADERKQKPITKSVDKTPDMNQSMKPTPKIAVPIKKPKSK